MSGFPCSNMQTSSLNCCRKANSFDLQPTKTWIWFLWGSHHSIQRLTRLKESHNSWLNAELQTKNFSGPCNNPLRLSSESACSFCIIPRVVWCLSLLEKLTPCGQTQFYGLSDIKIATHWLSFVAIFGETWCHETRCCQIFMPSAMTHCFLRVEWSRSWFLSLNTARSLHSFPRGCRSFFTGCGSFLIFGWYPRTAITQPPLSLPRKWLLLKLLNWNGYRNSCSWFCELTSPRHNLLQLGREGGLWKLKELLHLSFESTTSCCWIELRVHWPIRNAFTMRFDAPSGAGVMLLGCRRGPPTPWLHTDKPPPHPIFGAGGFKSRISGSPPPPPFGQGRTLTVSFISFETWRQENKGKRERERERGKTSSE